MVFQSLHVNATLTDAILKVTPEAMLGFEISNRILPQGESPFLVIEKDIPKEPDMDSTDLEPSDQ